MSLTFLLSILSIAIVDAINPSAIFMTFLLLAQGKNRIVKSLIYVLGIFITYFSIGLFLLLAYQFLGNSFKLDFGWVENWVTKPPAWAFTIQRIGGGLLLIYAVFFYKKTNPKPEDLNTPKPVKTASLWSVLLLGVTITFVEAPTALPYFGGISTIYLANLGLFKNIIFLALYNLVFVLPPLVVICLYYFNQTNFDQVTKKLKTILDEYSYTALKIGLIFLGAFLIYNSIFQ